MCLEQKLLLKRLGRRMAKYYTDKFGIVRKLDKSTVVKPVTTLPTPQPLTVYNPAVQPIVPVVKKGGCGCFSK